MTYLVESRPGTPFDQNTCRLCVQKEQYVWNIFEVCDSDGISLKLPEKIIALLNIMVEMNDGLPDQVCAKCMTVVRGFHDFRQQCQQNDALLRKVLSPNDESNMPKPGISDSLHVDSEQQCIAEWDHNTSPCGSDECIKSPIDLEKLPEQLEGRETPKVLDDFIVEVSLAEQLQQDWTNDDSCEEDAISNEPKKSVLPWRINVHYASESEVEDANQSEFDERHLNSLDGNGNSHLLLNNDMVLASKVHCDSELTPKCRHDDDIQMNSDNLSHGGINAAIEDPESESVDVESEDLKDASQVVHEKPGEEIFAGKISHFKCGYWVCNICKKEFVHLRQLKRHVKRHYSNTPYQCSDCQAMFQTTEALNLHKIQHSTSLLALGYTCEHCHKSFRQKHLLEKHLTLEHVSSNIRINHAEKFRETCGKCVRVFHSSVEMENHDESCNEGVIESEEDSPEESAQIDTSIRKKRNAKRKECHLCYLSFDRFPELALHFKEIHKSDYPLKCTELGCEKVFIHPKRLDDHVRRVHRRNYGCEYCGKRYSTKLYLQTHIRQLHTFEKPFKCEVCGKAFAMKRVCQEHFEAHARKYKCDKCDASFGFPYNLKRHQAVHSNTKPFICEVCGKAFAHMDPLRSHKLTEHTKNLVCSVCGKFFSNERRFKIHTYQHTKKKIVSCKLCDCTYTNSTHLRTHMKKIHPAMVSK